MSGGAWEMGASTAWHALALLWIVLSLYLGSISAFIGLSGLMAGQRAESSQEALLRHLLRGLLFYVSAVMVWTWAFDAPVNVVRNTAEVLLAFAVAGIMLGLSWTFVHLIDRWAPVSSWWPQVRMPITLLFVTGLLATALRTPNQGIRLVLLALAVPRGLLLLWEVWGRWQSSMSH